MNNEIDQQVLDYLKEKAERNRDCFNGFFATSEEISERLGISKNSLKVALAHLLANQLVFSRDSVFLEGKLRKGYAIISEQKALEQGEEMMKRELYGF